MSIYDWSWNVRGCLNFNKLIEVEEKLFGNCICI